MTLSGPVKLIIWDLDETLWTGVLSEGTVLIDPSRIDLIRELNRRGVVNSICSKNEVFAVKERLQEADLWDEFVFASVDWTPKGARVAQIIKDAQLRASDTLFIDDLALNREEVRHFAPGIQTADVDIIDVLLSLPELAGKDDSQLSRLGQYRVLERKLADRESKSESNEEFLRSCDIRIRIYGDASGEAKRLFELVSRSNQLNFTKRRPDWAAFQGMLDDPERKSGYVTVRDRYGDYGICGFYSMSQNERTLDDFVFSCRVLNMGVEQWVYSFLGRPQLSVQGDVASSLDAIVDWITPDVGESEIHPGVSKHALDGMRQSGSDQCRILIVGGCDLLATAQFLGGNISTDFHRLSATGAPVHAEHTEILRQALAGLSAEQNSVVDRIPFLDQRAFNPPSVFSPDYDVLVYSLLVDYGQGMYRHCQSGLIVTWCPSSLVVTDPDNWLLLESKYGYCGIDRAFLEWFGAEFEFMGSLTVDQFQKNLRLLAHSIPEHAKLVFVNGAEVSLKNSKEPQRHLRYIEMNAALDEVVATLHNVSLCDVRKFVLTESDLTDDIRHYRRGVYLKIAEEIVATGVTNVRLRPDSVVRRLTVRARRSLGPRRLQLRQMLTPSSRSTTRLNR